METTETKDTRPRRSGSTRSRAWPVIRTYYDAVHNVVIDVLEVTRVLPPKFGNPPETVIIEKHVHCMDEDLKARYMTKSSQIDIPNEEVK